MQYSNQSVFEDSFEQTMFDQSIEKYAMTTRSKQHLDFNVSEIKVLIVDDYSLNLFALS